jgi:hypothetical protein
MQPSVRKLAVTALAAAATIALLPGGVAAATPSPASGSIVPTSAIFNPPRAADGNLIIETSGTHAWTGTFTGTSTIDVRLVERDSGQATFQGFGTFTGSTPCGTGTMSFVTAGSGQLPFLTGRAVTIDQAAASLPVHANLNVSVVLTPLGAFVTYSGDVHCD